MGHTTLCWRSGGHWAARRLALTCLLAASALEARVVSVVLALKRQTLPSLFRVAWALRALAS